MKKLLQYLITTALALTACATRAADIADKTLSPYFWVKPINAAGADSPGTLDSLPLKSTSINTTIAGVIADVRVTQVYANTGTRPLEAVYIFPGSTRAAVHGLTMTIGDRVLEAKIKKREEARRTYEAAKTEGKTASLLEQQRPNVFQMNVANILPGDEVRVELCYTELLIPTDGVYEFVYPGVVGPRYSNKPTSTAQPEDKWVANPYLKNGHTDPMRYDITVQIAAGLPLSEVACPTHPTKITYTNEREARIATEAADETASNRDFICSYRLTGGTIQSGLLLAEGKDENFFLLTVQPPVRPQPAEIPPCDFVFIVDVSGSMNGFPLNTAKKLVHDLLSTLRIQDTFNLLLFAGDSQMLSPTSLPATPQNLLAAANLLNQQNGSGATELLPALKRALALPPGENVSRSIAIITDGYVDIEDEAFELVRTHLNRANLFAFGIGSSVNRHLIEGLARAGRGEPFIVTGADAAEPAAAKFRDYISSPVLTRIVLDFGGLDTYDVEPVAIPDLFAQRPIVVFGKWRGLRSGRITVRGQSGDKPYLNSFDVEQATVLPSAEGLAHLWARTRIAQLGDLFGLKTTDERIAAITNLGLNYNLLTKYTSFVAVDDVVRRITPTLQTVKQPLGLPQGVENSAVGQEIPTSPEPATGGLMIIAAGLLLAVLIRRHRAKKASTPDSRIAPFE
jgi:Ca-activated chloride channel family protein